MKKSDREAILDAANPLGLDGIAFIECTITKPQALGQVLEMMGFIPFPDQYDMLLLRFAALQHCQQLRA